MPVKSVSKIQAKSESADLPKSSVKNSRKNSATEKSPIKAVGYLRVSTGEQELDKNKADILRLANDANLGRVRFVEEKISGKISWHKRKVADILEELVKGDALIVSELSRSGRSILECILECMEILSVALTKGVNVYSVKGNWKLDNSIQSKIVAMAFSMAAEIERDLISQRTKEDLRYKKEQGINSADHPAQANRNSTLFARRYQATEATVSNWIKKTN